MPSTCHKTDTNIAPLRVGFFNSMVVLRREQILNIQQSVSILKSILKTTNYSSNKTPAPNAKCTITLYTCTDAIQYSILLLFVKFRKSL